MSKKWPQVSKMWELLAQRISCNSSFFQTLHYDCILSFVLCQLLLGSTVEADNGVGHNQDSGCTPYPFPQCMTDGHSGEGAGVSGMRVGGVVTTRDCLCILCDSLVILMARQSKEYVLWFNFILGSNLIFLCFKLIMIYYHTQKQRKIKFKPRT